MADAPGYTQDGAGFRSLNDDAYREEPTGLSGIVSFDDAKSKALKLAREQMLKSIHDSNRAVMKNLQDKPSFWSVAVDGERNIFWSGM